MKNKELIKARKIKRYTQEELAIMLGYRKSTVSNWENGYSSPSLSDAFKVSKILGQGVEELFQIY